MHARYKSDPSLRSDARDPLAQIMGLGSRRHLVGAALGALLALVAHGSAAARVAMIDVELLDWTHRVRLAINERLASTYDIDVEKPKPPPEAPPPAPEPKEEPKAEKTPPPPTPKEAAPPPPPAAAQAGKVLTQAPDDAPVDFTNSFVTGNGDTYAGGVTQANGTSTTAVRDLRAQAGGVPGGTGTKPAPAPVAQDLSRGLRVNDTTWSNCDFPPEADTEQINDMKVPMELTVSSEGKVLKADVLRDPGYGFKRAAIQCVMRQGSRSFTLALDRDGKPVTATMRVNVTFTR